MISSTRAHFCHGLLGLSLVLALAALPAAGEPPRPETNDFILRAPAAAIDGIAGRQGLEVVAEIDAAPDAQGHSAYLVRAPEAAPPELIVADVEELEPEAAGIEPAFLASLPETGEGLDLDQQTMVILGQLQQAQRFNPPSSVIDSGWHDDPEKRVIEAGKKADLELEMEHDLPDGDPQAYDLSVELAEGCAAAMRPETSPLGGEVELGAEVAFNGKRATWQLMNAGGRRLVLDRLDLAWPAANEKLKEIRLRGFKIFSDDRPGVATSIDSEWEQDGDLDVDGSVTRVLEPGETAQLRIRFDKRAVANPGLYGLDATFFETAPHGPCAVRAARSLELGGKKIKWRLVNAGSADVTLAALAVDWHPAGGNLRKVKLDGGEILLQGGLPVSRHGQNPDGSRRELWSAYVEQPAAETLRVKDAHKDHDGEAIVAIIDSGVDPDHPLFAHRLLPGYDFVRGVPGEASEWHGLDQQAMVILGQQTMVILGGSDAVPINRSTAAILAGAEDLDPESLPPAFGHGTMVAGLVHLTAPAASILPLRAFDGQGRGHLFDVVSAIYYAVDHGAAVINMSFSLETFSPELMRAVNYAARRGVTCVAAAGNEGEEVIVYPAAFGNAIGVAATAGGDALAAFSNHGSDLVSIAAPGEDLVTAYPGGGWALASGTSFAAGWISGAAALFADKNGGGGKADFYLASEALSHAEPVTGRGHGRSGHGRADLKRAMDRLRGGPREQTPASGIYSIVVELAEGCSVAYPPAVGGDGCSALPASQLALGNKRLEWQITNAGSETITLEELSIQWPAENGALKRIKLGGPDIDRREHPPATVTVDSGWNEHAERRQIEPGESKRLRLEFKDDAVAAAE